MGQPGKSNRTDMIHHQWYAVLDSHDVPGGRPVSIMRMGGRLVFWRDRPVIIPRRQRRALLDEAGIPEKP
jgi:hypothetical protein